MSKRLDGLTIASDEIIITDPTDDNLTDMVDEGDEVVVTPETARVETPVSRQYIVSDEDMDEEQLHAVDEYNDTQDEIVTTARTMGSQQNDENAGKDTGHDAFTGRHENGFEHFAHAAAADNAPTQTQTVSFAETVTETTVRYTSIDTRALIDQIVTQVRTQVTEGITTMSLELHPATLGKMYVQVTEQDGAVNAKLFTESESVKQALETAMTTLKEQWEQQGSKVSAIEISVGTREFEEQMETAADWNQNRDQGSNGTDEAAEQSAGQNAGNRSINLGDGEDGIPEDMTEAEALEASMMYDYGNTLSMRA
ncbi:MAG: flagellar hook-length control protein FliK [Lachnospiraceae bacterium]|nr:flagellar hook-length control protein FliK [Lachnospiraceae bacterium]